MRDSISLCIVAAANGGYVIHVDHSYVVRHSEIPEWSYIAKDSADVGRVIAEIVHGREPCESPTGKVNYAYETNTVSEK